MEKLAQLIKTVHQLRAPEGCPWDRAQTHQSLRQYLIEEAYEVLDVLDRIKQDKDILGDKALKNHFKEELGDLLMQVLLHSEMASQQGAFTIHDVAQALDEKLIRRHPHVFGQKKADNVDEALQNWEKRKAEEKSADPKASILDGLPKGLPALQRAARVIEKVTKVGFQWSDMNGPLQKLDEELAELKEEVRLLDQSPSDEGLRAKVANELGDLFFSLANIAFLLKISPEDGLRGTLSRFESRFKHVERRLKAQGKTPEQSDLQEMDRYWDEAKALEKQ